MSSALESGLIVQLGGRELVRIYLLHTGGDGLAKVFADAEKTQFERVCRRRKGRKPAQEEVTGASDKRAQRQGKGSGEVLRVGEDGSGVMRRRGNLNPA